MTRNTILLLLLLLTTNVSVAQRFFNLTADEVHIDSILPTVSFCMELPANYADSIYTAEVKYAEYIDMSAEDIANYNRISHGELLPAHPVVSSALVTSRKQPSMLFTLSPLVYRDGKYQILVSYMLAVNSTAANYSKGSRSSSRSVASRYAEHSVLASGRWGKIRVAKSGFHLLTEEVIRRAGFRNMDKVKLYGYGGNMVPESLSDSYLREYDDLKEVPSAIVDGRRIFYANGPVTWASDDDDIRIRNPYSDYGYYFITETDEEPLVVTAEELLSKNYPTPNDYHTLHEIDNFAWYEAGRNLVESTPIAESKTYNISSPAAGANGSVTVAVSCKTNASYSITVNGMYCGTGFMNANDEYDKAVFNTHIYDMYNLREDNEVIINVLSGGPLRLDYISICSDQPAPAPDLAAASLPAAEYVHNITNQDHHADEAVDLTILIPTSQNMLQQAERLKAIHEQHDGLSVRIVPADELYNEFSSGTPDVSAYRRYMKMMYDRASSEDELPRYLLLFGDCVWDNRLLTVECRSLSADNILLCHESENSSNAIYSYVSDDFIVMLDDEEVLGVGKQFLGTPDAGVGRFPVMTEAAAKNIVDKTIRYITNPNVGTWQNTIVFMGDDGNSNLHMQDVDTVANRIARKYPGFYTRKVMWDAYKRVSSSTGNRYPEVMSILKAQQQSGALIMDYAGHGAAHSLSHEYVLTLNDFTAFTNSNLPMWVTASCDVGPFDGTETTIGEMILNNTKGGGIGFFGTTRTVYANYNKYSNEYFLDFALGSTNGRRNTLGDANRLAKTKVVQLGNDQTVNKVQYSLLGDPALVLNAALYTCVVDSIDDADISQGQCPLVKANSKVRVKGHVEKFGEPVSEMEGLVNILVRDNLETMRCLQNDRTETPTVFEYLDRNKTLFSGTDSIHNGRFDITFTVPRDINYSNKEGLITLYAYNRDASVTAHGECDRFLVGGTEEQPNDSIGPSVYCYLNSPSFVNGQDVNTTPYFVAQIKDKNGINATGAGVGHDMQLVIDNQVAMTYNLNSNFQFDFGSYTSGSTFYSIPELAEGQHTLRFRVWDILNNPSTTTLSFNVVPGKTPELADVNVTINPAKTSTTFIATHDRPGAEINVKVEIFDMSGRLLHVINQVSIPDSQTTAVPWDLTTDSGSRMQTGVYLYRVNISGGGSNVASKAKKLIVI